MASTPVTLACVFVFIVFPSHAQLPSGVLDGLGNVVTKSNNKIVLTFSNHTKTFENFLLNYNRSYNAAELPTRLSLFEETLKAIESHNKLYDAGNSMHWLALNEFADWTNKEKALLTGTKISSSSSAASESRKKRAIDLGTLCKDLVSQRSVDWRKTGSVTAVKNQRRCGSCWAFSVVGSLEGQRQKITNSSLNLSEQQLVDCDTGNSGCNGGDPAGAFQYIKDIGGIMTAHSYPYTSSKGSCTFNKSVVAASVKVFNFVRPSKDECTLRKTVAEVGPISMAAHVTKNFIYYGGGVFTDDTCGNAVSSLNHAMLLVGYGVDGNTDYWIIKNSWGSSWGEDGYIRIISDNSNQCGVATYALYPVASARDVEDTSSFNRPALLCILICSLMSVAYIW